MFETNLKKASKSTRVVSENRYVDVGGFCEFIVMTNVVDLGLYCEVSLVLGEFVWTDYSQESFFFSGWTRVKNEFKCYYCHLWVNEIIYHLKAFMGCGIFPRIY